MVKFRLSFFFWSSDQNIVIKSGRKHNSQHILKISAKNIEKCRRKLVLNDIIFMLWPEKLAVLFMFAVKFRLSFFFWSSDQNIVIKSGRKHNSQHILKISAKNIEKCRRKLVLNDIIFMLWPEKLAVLFMFAYFVILNPHFSGYTPTNWLKLVFLKPTEC